MPDVVSEGTFIRLFADDSPAYRRVRTAEDQTTSILQRDLKALNDWASRWGMRFNPAKCQIMHLARSKPKTKMYELCDVFLETVNSSKYLGVVVSDDLQWHNQVCAVAKRANSALHLIARNLHVALDPQELLHTLPSYVQRWSIVPVCGIPISKETLTP